MCHVWVEAGDNGIALLLALHVAESHLMGVLGTKRRSSAKAGSVLNC